MTKKEKKERKQRQEARAAKQASPIQPSKRLKKWPAFSTHFQKLETEIHFIKSICS
jgi:hypothetical protein